MSHKQAIIRLEKAGDADSVETITQEIFGPGMKARAAYALREGVAHDPALSFVALIDGSIVGSVRLTRIFIGDEPVLLLGPLGVLPQHKHGGIGKMLMQQAVDASKESMPRSGCKAILLVGDLDYYKRFGFARVPPGSVTLPRPVDYSRVLVCELESGAAEGLSGAAHRGNSR